MIDCLVWETITNHISNDPLEHCMLNDSVASDEKPEVAMCAQF